MMNNHIKASIAFLGLGGLLYTFERFMSKLVWVSQVVSVNIKGAGSYPTYPDLPNIGDNLFILFFTLIGLLFLVVGIISIKRKNKL